EAATFETFTCFTVKLSDPRVSSPHRPETEPHLSSCPEIQTARWTRPRPLDAKA
ncbi:hypothetical protein RRG08_042081, partial [Elysia crispata]